MSEHTAEKDAATLTDKEIELREWLRSQPGGAERWTVIKAGFRRSYDMGMRDSLNARLDAEKDAGRATVAEALTAWEERGPTSLTVALVVDALYGVRERIEALHVEAYPGAGWCAGCHDGGKSDTYPCATRDALASVTSPAEKGQADA